VYAWLAHYAKRILETLFVHKFSRPTMPIENLFRNNGYYWLAAACVGYEICNPQYVQVNESMQLIGFSLMAVREIDSTHVICLWMFIEHSSRHILTPFPYIYSSPLM
jgi:hypothetical protein